MRNTRALLGAAGLALAAACSGRVVPADGGAEAARDTGPVGYDTSVDVPRDARTPPDARVPAQHRAAADACPTTRAAGLCPYPDAGGAGACASDTQCGAGANGRCVQEVRFAACSCSYDACARDSDCTTGGPCACRQANRAARGANACLAGDCRTDADCGPGGYCSPSLDFQCGAYSGVTGYYCHTRADTCVDDADCADQDGGPFGEAFCGYSRELGRWACSRSQCAG